MRYSFPKSVRVLSSEEFTRVLRRGTVAADGTLVIFALVTDDAQSRRVGVTIPKKTGNAVTRNRWKRLIRESYRTQSQRIPAGFVYVVRPKKGARPVWAEVERSLPALAQKASRRAGHA